jgi:hypothetical protein
MNSVLPLLLLHQREVGTYKKKDAQGLRFLINMPLSCTSRDCGGRNNTMVAMKEGYEVEERCTKTKNGSEGATQAPLPSDGRKGKTETLWLKKIVH